MNKIVIRKQWVRGTTENTYQIATFDNERPVYVNLEATTEECTDLILKNADGFTFDAKNQESPSGIISIMTWTKN